MSGVATTTLGHGVFFLFKASAVLPNGGITNTQGQNTRSSHLPSGMCEWRGHHFASGHAVLVKTYVLWSLDNAATCMR